MSLKHTNQYPVIPARPKARAGIQKYNNWIPTSASASCVAPPPPSMESCAGMTNRARQQGFSIVTAVFIIVILALLALGMMQLITTNQQSISQEATSVKAYFAGQSGLQWGMYQAVYGGATGSYTVTLSNSGLANTTIDLTLSSNTILTNTYYTVNAQGIYGTTSIPEYALRELELRFKP